MVDIEPAYSNLGVDLKASEDQLHVLEVSGAAAGALGRGDVNQCAYGRVHSVHPFKNVVHIGCCILLYASLLCISIRLLLREHEPLDLIFGEQFDELQGDGLVVPTVAEVLFEFVGDGRFLEYPAAGFVADETAEKTGDVGRVVFRVVRLEVECAE